MGRHKPNGGSTLKKQAKHFNGMLAELHNISVATTKADRKAKRDGKMLRVSKA